MAKLSIEKRDYTPLTSGNTRLVSSSEEKNSRTHNKSNQNRGEPSPLPEKFASRNKPLLPSIFAADPEIKTRREDRKKYSIAADEQQPIGDRFYAAEQIVDDQLHDLAFANIASDHNLDSPTQIYAANQIRNEEKKENTLISILGNCSAKEAFEIAANITDPTLKDGVYKALAHRKDWGMTERLQAADKVIDIAIRDDVYFDLLKETASKYQNAEYVKEQGGSMFAHERNPLMKWAGYYLDEKIALLSNKGQETSPLFEIADRIENPQKQDDALLFLAQSKYKISVTATYTYTTYYGPKNNIPNTNQESSRESREATEINFAAAERISDPEKKEQAYLAIAKNSELLETREAAIVHLTPGSENADNAYLNLLEHPSGYSHPASNFAEKIVRPELRDKAYLALCQTDSLSPAQATEWVSKIQNPDTINLALLILAGNTSLPTESRLAFATQITDSTLEKEAFNRIR